MFNASEYRLLRYGLSQASHDVDTTALVEKLEKSIPSRLIDSLVLLIDCPEDEAERARLVKVFESKRELVSDLLPHMWRDRHGLVKDILILLPSEAAAKIWADEVSEQLPLDSRRMFIRQTIEFIDGPILHFGGVRNLPTGRRFDLIFVLNQLNHH